MDLWQGEEPLWVYKLVRATELVHIFIKTIEETTAFAYVVR